MQRHLAIIPARSGSKSILNKNLIRLGNKSLIRIAVDKAMEADIFSTVLVTSDYPRFKLDLDGVCSGKMTQFRYIMRPEFLSTDEALMIDVVKHALKEVSSEFKWVWVLQPTSPFRSLADFKFIKTAVESGQYESVISWKPAHEYRDRMGTYKDGTIHPVSMSSFKNKEDLKLQFQRSGNFYVINKKIIEDDTCSEKWSWYHKPMLSYIMGGIDPFKAGPLDIARSRTLGLNIDSKEDLDLVKVAVNRGDVFV